MLLFTNDRYAQSLKRGDLVKGILNDDTYIITNTKVIYKYGAIGFPQRKVVKLSSNPFIRKLQFYCYPAYNNRRYCEGADKPEFLINRK